MSYDGKSVYRRDMRRVRCVCVGSWVSVRASHADEMKNGGRLKYMCQQNANPDNKEELQPSCAACVFNSTTPLP